MSNLLWQKPGVAVDAGIQAFLAGDDVLLDRDFFLHDIAASAAHAEGLQRIGILSADELVSLKRELGLLADTVSDQEILEAMIQHPILVNRPIVCSPQGVKLCRPSEVVLDLLESWPKGPYYKEDGEQILNIDGTRTSPVP